MWGKNNTFFFNNYEIAHGHKFLLLNINHMPLRAMDTNIAHAPVQICDVNSEQAADLFCKKITDV